MQLGPFVGRQLLDRRKNSRAFLGPGHLRVCGRLERLGFTLAVAFDRFGDPAPFELESSCFSSWCPNQCEDDGAIPNIAKGVIETYSPGSAILEGKDAVASEPCAASHWPVR